MDSLWELLFPPRCFVCDSLLEPADLRAHRRIHAACAKRLIPVREPYCMHCGCPLSRGEDEYCADCKKEKSFVTEGRSLFVYRGDVQTSMYRFKYGNRRRYALFLAREAGRRYRDWIAQSGVEVIVPVPMYRSKERRRGYNQAALFARELSRVTGLPFDDRSVRRTRNTRPQKELNRKERQKNVKNAFLMCGFGVNKRVLIVDDIYTTGATAEAVAEVLRRAGAERVYVLTACIGRGF